MQRQGQDLNLESRLSCLSGVSRQLANLYERLGVFTIRDLFELLPLRLEDRSRLRKISELPLNEDVVVKAEVFRVSQRLSKKGVLIIQASIFDDTGRINAVWFNQRYLLKVLQPNSTFYFFGQKRLVPSLGNPIFVKKIISNLAVVPIYPSTQGLTSAKTERLLQTAKPLLKKMPNLLPSFIRKRYRLSNRIEILDEVHYRSNENALLRARKLFTFEDFFYLTLRALLVKQERLRRRLVKLPLAKDFLRRLRDAIPVKLTTKQRTVAKEIINDMKSGAQMNRLLYGEVGSGKTFVALLAAGQALAYGQRVIWLTPTVALAHQHFEQLSLILKSLGKSTSLITGSNNTIVSSDLIIGTHALLNRSQHFSEIGLIVIDEQQRFGVGQRQALLAANPKAHLLMLSATPIPRSLAQTVLGYLDISHLKERLPHQDKVETVVFTESERPKIEQAIAERLNRGEPGYVICPLISDSENSPTLFSLEKKTVKSELERLKQVFPQARIALLHGQMPAQTKQNTIKKFRQGEIDVLISTTVVEVGIDNRNATWVLVENADQFGLAQLHQIRGRVGRGRKSSICFVSNSQSTELATKRLELLKSNFDGLEIAEADLLLRGPGNLVGFEQSGTKILATSQLTDLSLVRKVQRAADITLKMLLEANKEGNNKEEIRIVIDELKRRFSEQKVSGV